MAMTAASPWWHPDRHADRRPFLLARGRIATVFRGWLVQQGFVEVDTPVLQVSPGNETHLHAFGTKLIGPDHATVTPLWLHTSPEFTCKKLLAAGEPRIFTFAHVFRNRERTALHHPEFTLLEWYRALEPYGALMEDCAELLALAATAAGTRLLSHRGREADALAEPKRLSVAEAFDRHAGIDLLATLDRTGHGDRDALAAVATAAGLRVADDDLWTDIFSRVLAERVEPELGIGRPTILCEYPACEAALARAKPGDPRVAERFELYACGVELANAFGELTDPTEQRRRFTLEMNEKERIYGERYPIDDELLQALAIMPPASGIALGFDRLVMLATGAASIEQVIWAPVFDPRG
jgi:lysyl-tRNA synthetase class 2